MTRPKKDAIKKIKDIYSEQFCKIFFERYNKFEEHFKHHDVLTKDDYVEHFRDHLFGFIGCIYRFVEVICDAIKKMRIPYEHSEMKNDTAA